MILLDTNVVSNVMKKQPNLQVSLWLDSQPSRGLYLPTITIAEIYYGLNLLPKGKQTTQLTQLFEKFVSGGFVGNILDFDEEAAVVYAQIKATRQQQGRPMSMADAQIAAIAQVHHLALATRNIKDFEGCGLRLINPFEP